MTRSQIIKKISSQILLHLWAVAGQIDLAESAVAESTIAARTLFQMADQLQMLGDVIREIRNNVMYDRAYERYLTKEFYGLPEESDSAAREAD